MWPETTNRPPELAYRGHRPDVITSFRCRVQRQVGLGHGEPDQAGVTASPREVREVSAEEHDPACAHLTFIRVATRADVRQLLDSAR